MRSFALGSGCTWGRRETGNWRRVLARQSLAGKTKNWWSQRAWRSLISTHSAWTWGMASRWPLFRSRSPTLTAAWNISSIPWKSRRVYCAPLPEEISTARRISILMGRAEIWTTDAAALNGFENLALGELDSAPGVAFRFAHGRLLDVSAEFQRYFDDTIAKIRAGMRSQDLEDFKGSDGKLVATPSTSAERLHRLRMAKIKILELVWAYLYSGRSRRLGVPWLKCGLLPMSIGFMPPWRVLGLVEFTVKLTVCPRVLLGAGKNARTYSTLLAGRDRTANWRSSLLGPSCFCALPPNFWRQGGAEAEWFLDLVIDGAGK